MLYRVNIFLLVRAYSQRRRILIVYKPTMVAGSDFTSQRCSVITENNRVVGDFPLESRKTIRMMRNIS